MIKAVAWNIAHGDEPWRRLADMDADIALLGEASPPPDDLAGKWEIDSGPWSTVGSGSWKASLVKLSDKVSVEWIPAVSLAKASSGEFAVSREGTLAAAIVTPAVGESIVFISMYAVWERPNLTTKRNWIYADASVHRLISDISGFIGNQTGHRIIAAGDLNILHGYGDNGSNYWASRYASVFDRMDALGLTFAGPQSPAGLQADPWPAELPVDSANVPTFRTNRKDPASATRQLDFVFASNSLAKDVQVRALNSPDDWGPSDHCRIKIEVQA